MYSVRSCTRCWVLIRCQFCGCQEFKQEAITDCLPPGVTISRMELGVFVLCYFVPLVFFRTLLRDVFQTPPLKSHVSYFSPLSLSAALSSTWYPTIWYSCPNSRSFVKKKKEISIVLFFVHSWGVCDFVCFWHQSFVLVDNFCSWLCVSLFVLDFHVFPQRTIFHCSDFRDYDILHRRRQAWRHVSGVPDDMFRNGCSGKGIGGKSPAASENKAPLPDAALHTITSDTYRP